MAMRAAVRTLPPVREWPALVPPPGSVTWARAGDPRLLLAAGYALVLQVSHATVGRPLGAGEREQFWREWRALGRLLGIGEDDLPPSWERFALYFGQTVERRLERTPAAAEVLAALARPAAPAAAAPLRGLWS